MREVGIWEPLKLKWWHLTEAAADFLAPSVPGSQSGLSTYLVNEWMATRTSSRVWTPRPTSATDQFILPDHTFHIFFPSIFHWFNENPGLEANWSSLHCLMTLSFLTLGLQFLAVPFASGDPCHHCKCSCLSQPSRCLQTFLFTASVISPECLEHLVAFLQVLHTLVSGQGWPHIIF